MNSRPGAFPRQADVPAAGVEFVPLTGEPLAAYARDGLRALSSARLPVGIVLAAVAWRLISQCAAFFANVVFPLDSRPAFSVLDRPNAFWDALVRFDSGWYFGIARNGYAYIEGGRSNLAFFPTYPVSMGYLGYFLGGGQANYYYAGLIISWTAFAAGLVMLYRLARLDLDHGSALRACVLAAVFPFAFFYGAVYPESLFLLATVTTFYAFRRGQWALAALAGAVVTATRVNGILILPALALLVYQVWRQDPRQRGRAFAAVCCVPLGLVAYSTYAYMLSGSFIEWFFSIQRWDYTPGHSPLTAFATLWNGMQQPYEYLTTNAAAPYDLLNGSAALLAIGAAPFVWRRFGAPYAIYILANLALPLSSGHLVGLGRYTAVLFPLFLLFATIRTETIRTGILVACAMLYMLCQALFVTLHPVF